jgi:hypothetical protein
LPHRPVLEKTVEFLKSTLAKGPLSRKKVVKRARQRDITESQLYTAMPFAGIVSDGRRQGATWKLVGKAGQNGDASAKASAPAEPRDPGHRPEISPDATTAPNSNPARGAGFIPSAFQRRILDALKGKALTADKLQAELGCHREDLYARGLRELKAMGLVLNNRRAGGYYRPDFPPPEIAAFIGKN